MTVESLVSSLHSRIPWVPRNKVSLQGGVVDYSQAWRHHLPGDYDALVNLALAIVRLSWVVMRFQAKKIMPSLLQPTFGPRKPCTFRGLGHWAC